MERLPTQASPPAPCNGLQAQRVIELGIGPAARRFHYFTTYIKGMGVVETPQVPNMAVDGGLRTLYVNPDWFAANVEDNDLEVMVSHEVLHVRLRHTERWEWIKGYGSVSMEVKRSLWGFSTNWEINQCLGQIFRMPKHADMPPGNFHASLWVAEAIFKELLRLYEANKLPPELQQRLGDITHGSQIYGTPGEWEEGEEPTRSGLADMHIESIPSNQMSPLRTLQGFEDMIANYHRDWGKVLLGALGRIVSSGAQMIDYTYMRRSRRQSATTVLLPGITRYAPQITIVTDCSSSMDVDQLSRAAGACGGLATTVGHPLNVLYCNGMVVKEVTGVFSARDLPHVVPEGGTHLDAAWPVIKKHYPTTNVVVFLTDGEYTWEENIAPHNMRVVVGLTEVTKYRIPPRYHVVKLYNEARVQRQRERQ